MKKIKIILAGLVFIGLNVSDAWAKSYSVGVEPFHSPPYFDGSGEEYKGFARDLLDKFAKDAGIEFRYSAEQIPVLNKHLVQERIDFKFPDNHKWAPSIKKDKKIIYSNVVTPYIDGSFSLKTKDNAQLVEVKRLGSIAGYTPRGYMEGITSGKIFYTENGSVNVLIHQLLDGKIDTLYANVMTVIEELRTNFPPQDSSRIFWNEDLPYVEGSFHLSTVLHPEIVNDFNQWMVDNKEWIDQLKQKYLITLPQQKP